MNIPIVTSQIISVKNKMNDYDLQLKQKILSLPFIESIRAACIHNQIMQKRIIELELDKRIDEIKSEYKPRFDQINNKINSLIQGERLQQMDLDFIESYFEKQYNQIMIIQETSDIPLRDYWLNVLKNCDYIKDEIQKDDEKALQQLKMIDFTQDDLDYKINFHFYKNEFFSNTLIQKQLFFDDNEEFVKTESDQILWKYDKNLIITKVEKQQINFFNGKKRYSKVLQLKQSFFNLFDQLDKSDITDQNKDEINDKIDLHMDLCQILMKEAIPYSLEYYLNIKINENDKEYVDV